MLDAVYDCVMMNLLVSTRSGRFGWRFEIEPVGGKRRWISKSGFRTKAEATQDGYRAISAYMQTGLKEAATGTGTVADLAESWYVHDILPISKQSTAYAYRCIIDTHIIPLLGDKSVCTLTGADVLEFRDFLMKKGLSALRVNGIMGKLSAMLRYAVAPLGWIRTSPADGIRPLRTERQNIGILTKDEVNSVFASLPTHADECLPLMLAYYCGLRLSEVFGLMWDDITGDCTSLTVRRQADTVSGHWVLTPPKTASSVRCIAVPGELAEALRDARDRQHDDELAEGDRYIVQRLLPDGCTVVENARVLGTDSRIYPVLRRPSGHMYLKTTFKNCMSKVRRMSGVDFHFHQLRHTNASLLLAGGVDAANIASLLGHSSPRITLDVYTHATGMTDSAADKILSLTVGDKR